MAEYRGREPAEAGEPKHCCYVPEGKDPKDPVNHCEQGGSIELKNPTGRADYCGDHAGEMRQTNDEAYNSQKDKKIL